MSDTVNSTNLPFCDIVMKGGITSGVVYPLAIVELHKEYRIKSVGGTSAGALAAAIVAAAEYNRESGGYEKIEALPDEIAPILLSLFQPDPQFRPLYDTFLGLLDSKSNAAKVVGLIRSLFGGYPRAWIPWAIPGVLLLVLAIFLSSFWMGVLGVLGAIAGATYGLLRKLVTVVREDIPANDFGICSGLKTEGSEQDALTEWLADKIDEVAGLPIERGGTNGRPLNFGDLRRDEIPKDERPTDRVVPSGHRIELATMTTDLMMRRPYRLPFRDDTHFFSEAEFRKLFPARVVDLMIAGREPWSDGADGPADLYPLPRMENLPIVVVARMSLSFPGLIRAVPLWKRDFTRTASTNIKRFIRCLFTDGGLSSNFPIHFFDSLLPRWPTFAIALQPFHPERHIDEDGGQERERRVWMNKDAGSGQILPIHEITSVGSFLMTLFDAAKDWQDNLQSTLPGYRERIAHIALKPDEGGLNLAMPPEVVKKLTGIGGEAGRIVTSPPDETGFDFDDHRWRRLLVAVSKMEEELIAFARSWNGDGADAEGYEEFLARYPVPASYKPLSGAWRDELLERARALAVLGSSWSEDRKISDDAARIPRPRPGLRITPRE